MVDGAADKASEMADAAGEQLGEMADKAGDMADSAGTMMKDGADKAKDMLVDKEAQAEAMRKAKLAAEKARDNAEEALDD